MQPNPIQSSQDKLNTLISRLSDFHVYMTSGSWHGLLQSSQQTWDLRLGTSIQNSIFHYCNKYFPKLIPPQIGLDSSRWSLSILYFYKTLSFLRINLYVYLKNIQSLYILDNLLKDSLFVQYQIHFHS